MSSHWISTKQKDIYRTLSINRPLCRVIVRSVHKAGEVATWTHTLQLPIWLKVIPAPFSRSIRVSEPLKTTSRNLRLGFDKTYNPSFIVNTAGALICGAIYNLIQLFKQLLIPKNRGLTVASLQFSLSHIAEKVTRYAHKIVIRLASNHVH